MSQQTVADFFAIVLIGAAIATGIAAFAPAARTRLGHSALPLTAAMAVGATAGSLYFSEVANFVPCELCWYQRIAMYPLALILPLAALREDRSAFGYTTPLAIIGLGIAAYHIQLQLFPEQSSFCALANPCTDSPTKALGFMTIPHMSAISFALILSLTLFHQMTRQDTST